MDIHEVLEPGVVDKVGSDMDVLMRDPTMKHASHEDRAALLLHIETNGLLFSLAVSLKRIATALESRS